MANDFKRFAKAGVSNNTGASADAIYTVPAGAGSSALESIVIGISLANTSTSQDTTVSVFLDNYDGTNDVHVVKTVSLPASTQIELMTGNKLVLQNNGTTGDVLRVYAANASIVDSTVSVLEDV